MAIGIPLQFNGSYDTESFKNCVDSGGFCGSSGCDQLFACICKNGATTKWMEKVAVHAVLGQR